MLADAISLHDIEGVYLYASPAFQRLFGWDPDELTGSDCYRLFHPDDIDHVQQAHSRIIQDDTPVSVQYRLRCHDGSYRWVETSAQPAGHDTISAVTRPVSDRRSLLQALADQRMIAERVQEVERERQAFLTSISHAARHPMTVVSGFTQLLASGRVTDEADRTTIYQRLADNAERLSKIIQLATEAEELSRLAAGLRRTAVDLSALAREVATKYWDLSNTDSTVTLDTDDRAVVFADRARLEVAVGALFDNTVKHTPVGTRVWIRTHTDGDTVALTVEDDGPGVPDSIKPLVFDRLSSLGPHDNPNPGMGLGLYLVDQIARSHDGRAHIQDRPGGGAVFHLQLPARTPTRRHPDHTPDHPDDQPQ